MSWAQGVNNYYATQDTNHGYRHGVDTKCQFLNALTESDEHNDSHPSGYSQRYSGVDEHFQNLELGSRFLGYNSGLVEHQGLNPNCYDYGYGTYGMPPGLEQSMGGYHDGHSYDSSSNASDSVHYRGFGYYQNREEPISCPPLPYPP